MILLFFERRFTLQRMILFPIQQKAYISRRDNVDVSKDTTNKDGIMYNLIYLEGQKELPDHCIDAGVSFLYSL